MTLKAVVENKESFLKLEPNLNIVLDYCQKYGKTNSRTIGDVIESFLTEPIEIRYANEVRENGNKKALLLQKKEKLETIKTFFIEKEITPCTLDSNIQKLKRKPEDYSYHRNVTPLKKSPEEDDFSFSYTNLGFDFKQQIFICPVCQSLFAEASNASFDIVEAQRKAQHDAEMASDWDDDDDWGDEDF